MIGREDRSRYASALLDLTEALVRDYQAPAGVVLSTVQKCLLELGGTSTAPLDALERDVRARLAADGHLPVHERRTATGDEAAEQRRRLVDLTRAEPMHAVRPGA